MKLSIVGLTHPVERRAKNFELADALISIFSEMNIPVIYDVDIGHVPPQLTLVNGAFANVTFYDREGTVTMSFI